MRKVVEVRVSDHNNQGIKCGGSGKWEKLSKVDKDFGDTLIEVRYCTKCPVCGEEREGSAVRARIKFFEKDR